MGWNGTWWDIVEWDMVGHSGMEWDIVGWNGNWKESTKSFFFPSGRSSCSQKNRRGKSLSRNW